MRISELIVALQLALEKHGDLSVVGTYEGQVNEVDPAFMYAHGDKLYVEVENLRMTWEGNLAGLPGRLNDRQVRARR